MSGKGDKRRPGTGYGEGFDRIFGRRGKGYRACNNCDTPVTVLNAGDDGIDFCDTCDEIVEGGTHTCYGE